MGPYRDHVEITIDESIAARMLDEFYECALRLDADDEDRVEKAIKSVIGRKVYDLVCYSKISNIADIRPLDTIEVRADHGDMTVTSVFVVHKVNENGTVSTSVWDISISDDIEKGNVYLIKRPLIEQAYQKYLSEYDGQSYKFFLDFVRENRSNKGSL